MLLGVSSLGYFLGSSEEAQEFMTKALSERFPKSADKILIQINDIITTPRRGLINGLSILGLMWSGLKFFNILHGVLNSVWVGARQRMFLWGRLVALAIFIMSGFIFWFSFLLSSLMAAISGLDIKISGVPLPGLSIIWFFLEFVGSTFIAIIAIFLVYFLVPNVKVSVKAALIGATFSAVSLELSQSLFSFIVVKFGNYGSVYGSLASFIIFMTWMHLSMNIILMGAELGSQYQRIFYRKREEINNP
jgi:membrane protein